MHFAHEKTFTLLITSAILSLWFVTIHFDLSPSLVITEVVIMCFTLMWRSGNEADAIGGAAEMDAMGGAVKVDAMKGVAEVDTIGYQHLKWVQSGSSSWSGCNGRSSWSGRNGRSSWSGRNGRSSWSGHNWIATPGAGAIGEQQLKP